MSVFTKAAAVRTARWSTVPAIAAAAVALAAGPALAEGTAVGISTYSGSVYAGELTVGGGYQCTPDTPYDNLKVTVYQETPRGLASDTSYQRVPCTGGTETWQAWLRADQWGNWFTYGNARVDVTLWAPDDPDGRATSSLVLWVQ
jgi:hypothetical protein